VNAPVPELRGTAFRAADLYTTESKKMPHISLPANGLASLRVIVAPVIMARS
jgi:hypothetical protein